MVLIVWGTTLASRPKGQQPRAAALSNEVFECHQPCRAPLYDVGPLGLDEKDNIPMISRQPLLHRPVAARSSGVADLLHQQEHEQQIRCLYLFLPV